MRYSGSQVDIRIRESVLLVFTGVKYIYANSGKVGALRRYSNGNEQFGKFSRIYASARESQEHAG